MKKNDEVSHLPDFENEVFCWIEQESSIMLKASTEHGDPVELTAENAKLLARILNQKASELDTSEE